MKKFRQICIGAALLAFVTAAIPAQAADTKGEKKPKPYPLKTCIVSGEKLGDHGKPYVFTHEDREIKMCCKGCLKDFKKDPDKYLKQIDEAVKKSQDKHRHDPSHRH